MQPDSRPIDPNQLRIASPCSVSWDSMEGDARKRHCGQCKLDVYNISEMTRAEIQDLLRGAKGRTCIQLFRRHDGTVLTRDCPARLRRIRRAVVAAFALLIGALGIRTAYPLEELMYREAGMVGMEHTWNDEQESQMN